MRTLYPEIAPYQTGTLQVDGRHTLYWEQCGNPAGKPAVIDVPRGKGHIILMSTNPMWRMNTSGLYALVMNSIMELAP